MVGYKVGYKMPFHHCYFSDWWSHICLRYIGNLFLMIYKPQLHICAKSHCYQSALKNNSLQFFPPKLIINSGTRALFMISAVDIRTKLTIGSFKCVWPIIMCFKYLLYVLCLVSLLPPRQIPVHLCYMMHLVILGLIIKGAIHPFFL